MDAPTAHGVCGDGILDVATETCDDGNTVSGDGCSSTCQTEVVNKCGNGVIDSGETCDDGNQAGSDGCSAQCTVETGYMCTGAPSVCTMMTSAMGTCASPMVVTLALSGALYTGTGTGDTTTATSQVAGGMCDGLDSSGGGPDQIWTFVNPIAQPVLITLHPGAADFDGVLRMTTAACDVATEVPDDILPGDDGVSDGCSDIGGGMGDEHLNYNNLAAGTYYIVVDGYSADPDDMDFGPYMFDIQAGHGTCGNGTIEFGETCDDGNHVAGDGCDATCHTETGYTCTGMPSTCMITAGTCGTPFPLTLTVAGAGYVGSGASDTTGATNGFAAGMCGTESMAGAAPDQTWVFTNPVAQPVVITGTSTTDIVLRLTTTACNIATSVTDTTTGCADLNASGTAEVLNYAMLPAGTYYLTIDGYSSDETGPYSFTLKAGNTAVCGDGNLDAGETCDDHNTTASDGCSATCQVETGYACIGSPSVCHPIVCGDGIVDGTEQCDSNAGHEFCDATCHLVFDTTDTENNNDAAHAQVITPVHHIIEGSLPVGDLDVYKFTLTAPSVVEIETYTTFESTFTSSDTDSEVPHLECPTADTLLNVFDSTADPTDDSASTYGDDDSGDLHCSYLGPTAALPAGTYYFTVHEFELDDVIPRYLVDFRVTPM